MMVAIKEMRESTGMTQKAFAEQFGIPLSTLKKWEQGEAKPANYIVQLIARQLSDENAATMDIVYNEDIHYYYDELRRTIRDTRGNSIYVSEDLKGVKEQNLALYAHDLFQAFYEIQQKFSDDCRFDKKEDIIWS